jgi:hypothetical protein
MRQMDDASPAAALGFAEAPRAGPYFTEVSRSRYGRALVSGLPGSLCATKDLRNVCQPHTGLR